MKFWHCHILVSNTVVCIVWFVTRYLFVFDCEHCSRSPKHSFVVVLVVKPLVKKLQICIFLVSWIKLDYTRSYWIKLDQILKKPFWKSMLLKQHVLKDVLKKKDHIGSNWIKSDQILKKPFLKKHVLKKVCSKRAWSYKKWSKNMV